MLDKIRIVLVNTTHAGNIGGVARAMKNMGLAELYLVEPKDFPSVKADARASGADDILQNAILVNTLAEAITDCQLVAGTSARQRHIPWPLSRPREFAAIAADVPGKVAVVFGREDRGLTNEELQLCHQHIHIPTVADFSSLNVAAAVQLVAYELHLASLEQQSDSAPNWGVGWDIERAEHQDLELLFEHLENTLIDIDFLDADNPRQLMPRLRRLFLRALPDKIEVNVLRGILTQVECKIKSD